MRELFLTFPGTTLVCITRVAAQKFNDLAQAALFENAAVLCVRKFDEGVARRDVQVHAGLRCLITRNIHKECGLINGARCVVQDALPRALVVDLDEGRRVLRLHFEKHEHFYCLARGYAVTLMKIQGMTLPHVTLVPDLSGIPGAGYVAISRVRALSDLLFYVRPRLDYFVPSSETL